MDADPGAPVMVRLYPSDGGSFIALTTGGWAVGPTADGQLSMYHAADTWTATGIELNKWYYMLVQTADATYYSTEFYAVAGPGGVLPEPCDDNESYCLLSWSTSCGIKGGGYKGAEGSFVFLNSLPKKMVVSVEESDGETDVDGAVSIGRQTMRTRRSISLYGTEHLAEALASIAIFDYKSITFLDNTVWPITSTDVNFSPIEDDCGLYGEIEFSFEFGTLTRTGCEEGCD